jgi:hypothetical protein
MKFKLYLLTLLFPISLCAQEQPEIILLEKYTLKQVGQMAIFPGCEKINPNDKSGLTKCMSEKLNKLLEKGLGNFPNKFIKDGYSAANARIRFVVSKEGKLIQIQAIHDSIETEANLKLALASEKAFKEIAPKVKHIQPALVEDDLSPVNLQYDLPITFKVGETEIGKMKWSEIVVATMYDGIDKYEVRKSKDQKSISVYLVEANSEKFLQKFNDLDEMQASERLGAIFQRNPEKGLMVDKKVNSKHQIRIYYSNVDPTKFNVYSVTNGKEPLREIIQMADLICSELYLKAILR